MLDKKFLREHPDEAKDALSRRGRDYVKLVDKFLALDEESRRTQKALNDLQEDKNRASKEIAELQKAGKRQEMAERIDQMKVLGMHVKAMEEEFAEIAGKIERLMLELPNIPHPSVPFGMADSDKTIVSIWGEPRDLGFPAKDHLEIAARLGLIDFEAGARVSGHGYYFFRGWGARLQQAIIQWMLDVHQNEHGYVQLSAPYLVLAEAMVGTGQLPKFADDMYGLEGGAMYLIPTAEVPVTNYHRDSIIENLEEPIKYCAYTACFRREAGSYGKAVKGLIRVHQFDKVELVNFTTPHTSYERHEGLTREAEEILKRLGLHFRRTLLPTGDMTFGSAKTYDLEVWLPSDGSWQEVSSSSNYEDFQARRANIRYRDPNTGKPFYAHTLNASGVALPRLYAAILENYQTADGGVEIPPVLRDYLGGREKLTEADRM
ncbi:MAG: serine--tRNA ligase [bacterium]|jgi:seryl-tRNA synthetase